MALGQENHSSSMGQSPWVSQLLALQDAGVPVRLVQEVCEALASCTAVESSDMDVAFLTHLCQGNSPTQSLIPRKGCVPQLLAMKTLLFNVTRGSTHTSGPSMTEKQNLVPAPTDVGPPGP